LESESLQDPSLSLALHSLALHSCSSGLYLVSAANHGGDEAQRQFRRHFRAELPRKFHCKV
jgi:hypothetical protein